MGEEGREYGKGGQILCLCGCVVKVSHISVMLIGNKTDISYLKTSRVFFNINQGYLILTSVLSILA